MGAAESHSVDELEQEPEVAPCHSSSSPLSPQLSMRGATFLGPFLRVSDPYNILSPDSASPRLHGSSRLQCMSSSSSPRQSLPPWSLSGENVCTEIYLIRHAESTMNARPELIAGRSPSASLTATGKRQARALGVHLRSLGVDFDAVYSSPLERAMQTAFSLCQELGIPREAVEMTEAVQELGQGQWEGRLRSEIYTPAMLSVLNSTQPDFRAPGGESQRQVEFRMVEFFNNVALPRASVAVQAARGYRQRGSKEHLNKTQHASIQVHPLEEADVSRAKDWGISDLHTIDSSKDFLGREFEEDLHKEEKTPDSVGYSSESGMPDDLYREVSTMPYIVAVITHGMAIKCLLRGLLGSSPFMTIKWSIDNTSVTVLRHSTNNGWQIRRVNDTSHLRHI